jgi:hypothetical protein
MPGSGHVRFGGRGGKTDGRETIGVPPPTRLAPLDAMGTQLLFRVIDTAYERRSKGR